MTSIAYFISPHGFGHASRASAVMQTLAELLPSTTFELFTTIPDWFFKDSLSCSFEVTPAKVDIGMIQATPLTEDPEATLTALQSLYPITDRILNPILMRMEAKKCELAICDISPVGIVAARKLGIPSVLIESFTWDWIYEGYLKQFPQFSRYISILRDTTSQCDFRIQTEPLCQPVEAANRILPPISRTPRSQAAIVRQRLNLRDDQKMVLLTMGGIEFDLSPLSDNLSSSPAVIVLQGSVREILRHGNLIYLPHHSPFYHPDLINASDAIISKLGYSTIAEAYYPGIPFGYITREKFRESAILEQFAQRNIPSAKVSTEHLSSNRLHGLIDHLLHMESRPHHHLNGALLAAEFISSLISDL